MLQVVASRRRTFVLLLVAGLALCNAQMAQGGYRLGPDVTLDPAPGDPTNVEPVTVYDYDWQPGLADRPDNRNTCHPEMYPDMAVRAFYDDQNRVQMILGNGGNNHRLMGPDLESLKPEQKWAPSVAPPGSPTYPDARPCDTPGITPDSRTHNDIHEAYEPHGPDEDDPRSYPQFFHNLEWMDSVWTKNGRDIYALIHNEYHGEIYGNCLKSPTPPALSSGQCYMSSITSAFSTDSGANYRHEPRAPIPAHRVANLPYEYEPDKGHVGYAAPTNIVKVGSAWIAYFIARGCQKELQADGQVQSFCRVPTYVPAQESGLGQNLACVMLGTGLESALGLPEWKAWGKTNVFNVSFTYPYLPPNSFDPPENHVCKPMVGLGEFYKLVPRSLSYNSSTGKYILVMNGRVNGVNGIYYSYATAVHPDGTLSSYWSEPRLIVETPTVAEYCANTSLPKPLTYASLIDPTPGNPGNPNDGTNNTAARNFTNLDDTGAHVDLFVKRDNTCNANPPDRDLVRFPIRFIGPH